MKFPLKFIFLFFSLQLISQSHNDYHKAEEYIILNKLDSANFYISKLENSADKSFLLRLTNTNKISYSDYYQFISNLAKRENVDYEKIAEFVNSQITEPKSTIINVDFFNIKWLLITKLRDDEFLSKASIEQNKLEKYVSKFNVYDKNFLWAQTKLNTHPIVMFLIEKKLQKGKELASRSLQIAKDIDDIELQIIFLYYGSDFLVYEKKLNEYIEVCEKSLELEKKLPQRSSFYYPTITNLINAYIFKGGYDKEVNTLINQLYKSYYRTYSYALYAQLISTLEDNSLLKSKILEKFKVGNVLELVEKFKDLGKNLNSNDFLDLINRSSFALAKHKYYLEALEYKHQALNLTKKIYSEELSESLANYKTFKAEEIVKAKEKEIILEKEETRLYFIITLLCLFLLVVSFVVLRKIRKQSVEIAQKNKIVKKSLEEKELIIKEMHHRVKNNFQLITSLLDLGTDEIKDAKIIEILDRSKSRIKSMSLINQKLYGNESGLIQFDEFINLLVKELRFLYKYDNNLDLKVAVNEIYFDVDTAIPLALILNELITNTFKYAFKNEAGNILMISLKKNVNNNFELIVKDNGQGLDKDFNIDRLKSSGLKLVQRLVKQLQGELELTNISGLQFKILFKDTHTRKQTV
ncbi:MAG: sensor histidine kinase [Polaribacter sp.]|nr:sensor histidine kinase [Polaribacter sp.]